MLFNIFSIQLCSDYFKQGTPPFINNINSHSLCGIFTKQKSTFSNRLRNVRCSKKHYGRSFIPAVSMLLESLQGHVIVFLLSSCLCWGVNSHCIFILLVIPWAARAFKYSIRNIVQTVLLILQNPAYWLISIFRVLLCI